jgi:hypothetical protein
MVRGGFAAQINNATSDAFYIAGATVVHILSFKNQSTNILIPCSNFTLGL